MLNLYLNKGQVNLLNPNFNFKHYQTGLVPNLEKKILNCSNLNAPQKFVTIISNFSNSNQTEADGVKK